MRVDVSPAARVIVILVGIGRYEKPAASAIAQGRQQLPALAYVRKDLDSLARLFATPRYAAERFQVIRVTGGGAGTINKQLLHIVRGISAHPGRRVVLVWSGHAEVLQADLRLATFESFSPMTTADGVPPTELVNKLSASAADAGFLLLDVCRAAHVTADVSEVAAKRLREQPPGQNGFPGFAALFSAQAYEPAADGVFVDVLERVLRHGPSDVARQLIADRGWGGWSDHSRLLTPTELANVLQAEFIALSTQRRQVQQPRSVTVGSDFGLFPNPLFRSDAQPASVSAIQRRWVSTSAVTTHFLPKARGLEPGEDGWYFTGRVDVGRRIADWLRTPEPARILVVTGDAGVGKSAVIGRTVALSDSGFRQALSHTGWDEERDQRLGTLPPLDRIDAALHLRGVTASRVINEISELLGLDAPGPGERLETSVARVPIDVAGRPPTVVFDALDEAEDPALIVSEIIRPLAERGCRFLIGTRSSAAARGAPMLLDQLTAPGAMTYRLSASQSDVTSDVARGAWMEDTAADADIAEYVKRRLKTAPDSGYADDASLRKALAQQIAVRARGRFLYARMSVDALLRRPPVALDSIDDALARDVEELFTRELAALDAQFRAHFGRHDPGASAFLSALAWSEGQGVPIRDGLWPLLATSIEEPPEPYTPGHAQWLLSAASQYIVESGDGDQAVYRLYHKSLDEYFRAARNPAVVRRRIASGTLDHIQAMGGWRLANRYVAEYAPSYVDDADRLELLTTDAGYLSRALHVLGVDGLAAVLDNARIASRRLSIEAVAKATRRSRVALHRDPAQLATQLYARLSDETDPALQRLVSDLSSIASPVWLRARHARLGWRAGLQTMQTFRGNVRALAFGDVSGATVLGVGAGSEVIVWDPRLGEADRRFDNDGMKVTALGFGTVDGRDLVAVGAGYHDGLGVVLRDLRDGRVIGDQIPATAVRSLALGPRSTIGAPEADVHQVTVGADGSTLWWSDAAGRIAHLGNRPQCITVDGAQAVVTDLTDGSVRAFPRMPHAHALAVLGLAFDEPVLAQLSTDRHGGVVHVGRADGEQLGRAAQIDFPVRCLAVGTVDGELVVAAASNVHGADDKVSAYVALRQPLHTEEAHAWRAIPGQLRRPEGIGRIADHFVALGQGAAVDVVTLDVIRPDAKAPLQVGSGVAAAPSVPEPDVPRPVDGWRVLLSQDDPAGWPVKAESWGQHDGRVIAIRGSYYGAVWIYDTRAGRFSHGPFAKLPDEPHLYYGKGDGEPAHVTDVAIGRLGRRTCVVVAYGGRPYLYDLDTESALPAPDPDRSTVVAVALGRIGRRSVLVTGSDGGSVAVWDARTGVRLAGVMIDDPVSGVWLTDDTILVRTYDRPFDLFDVVERRSVGTDALTL